MPILNALDVKLTVKPEHWAKLDDAAREEVQAWLTKVEAAIVEYVNTQLEEEVFAHMLLQKLAATTVVIPES